MKIFLWIAAIILISINLSSCSNVDENDGDAKNQLQNNSNNIATVDGRAISIDEFQKRYLDAAANFDENGHQDANLIQYFTVESLIYENLLNKEYKDLNINVTKDEIYQALYNDPLTLNFVKENIGLSSVEEAQEVIFNPEKYQIDKKTVIPLQELWAKREREIIGEVKLLKLQTILFSCLQPNNLDIKAIKAEKEIENINLTSKEYTSLDDKDFKVSDEELKALYNKKKQSYKTKNEIRKIAYIALDVKASEKDKEHAKTLVKDISEQLKSKEGLGDARSNSELSVQEKTETLASSMTEPWIYQFLKNAKPGDISPIKNYPKDIIFAKLLNIKHDIDSVKLDIVFVNGPKTLRDSVLNALNNGKTINDFAGSKSIHYQKDIWENLMLYNKSENANNMKKQLQNAEINKYFILNDNKGSENICRVTKKNAPKKMFDIAIISCTIKPSDETHNKLINDLQQYTDKNNNPTDFVKNAIDAGYEIKHSYLTKDLPFICHIHDIEDAQAFQNRMINVSGHHIGAIRNSFPALQWVFANPEGSISKVIDKKGNHGKILVIVIEDIISKGYIPYNESSVKADLTAEIIKNKKADYIINSLPKGNSDIKSYAKALGSEINSTTADNNTGLIPSIGIEEKLTGAVFGSEEGIVSNPIAGNKGVYIFQIPEKRQNKFQISDEEAKNIYLQRFSETIVRQLYQILRTGADINTNLDKVYK